MEVGRPATKAQPSRKGKKAWRKNVDIDEVEKGLEEAREYERSTGVKDIKKADEGELFTVDVAGEEELKPRKMKEAKPLKATEILARRSAVPALVNTHTRKQDHSKPDKKGTVDGVASSEVGRLMRVAGRVVNKSSTKASVDKEGFVKGEAYDVWDEPAPETKKKSKKQQRDFKDYSFLSDLQPQSSFNKPSTKPETLNEAPISFLGDDLTSAIVVADGGQSYNPNREEWLELLQKEHDREQVREEERLKLEAEKERVEELMRNLPDEEAVEEEEVQDEGDETLDTDLKSINPPVKVKTKTKQQRAKQERHKGRMEMEKRVKDLKQQIRDLHNLPKLIKEEMARLQAKQEEEEQTTSGQKRKKKLGKHHIKKAPLEVKLSDELEGTLRRLKPEGDLTSERFRNLQQRGLIEARVPFAKRRRYNPKVTEKWTYKDYK